MWGNWTYIILILGWALPVILFQWLVGLDLLRRHWRVWLLGILVPTVYLTMADSLALGSGTWTIDPQQSLNIFFPGIHVPIEEGIFFLVTNTLLIQGLILFQERVSILARVRRVLRLTGK